MPASLRGNFLSPLSLGCFVLTAAIGFGLDQWTKHEAFAQLCSGVVWFDKSAHPVAPRTVNFIPGLLEFTVTTNQGAVFGFGQGQRTLFIMVSAAAILFIVYLFATSGAQRMYQIILGLLLAGVLGNLYDRLQYSYVRDMIHGLPRWPTLFPYIFNVADTMLCAGVGLMIVHSLFHNPDRATPAVEAEAA
jgi:signal peptidase II